MKNFEMFPYILRISLVAGIDKEEMLVKIFKDIDYSYL